MNETLLEIKDLVIHYKTDSGVVGTVDGMSLVLNEGQPLGLVGETGAGEATAALGILRLLSEPPARIVSDEIHSGGRDVLAMDKDTLQKYRGRKVSIIFQDPMASLSPVMIIGEQAMESLEVHESNLPREGLATKAQETLEVVGIREERFSDYPHRFSGDMRQRVVVAIALYCNPKLLTADEPTTTLGVTVQAQMLDMICTLRNELQTSMMLIIRDPGLMMENCDMVVTIYIGEIVEYGNPVDIFENARHPYTVDLFGCISNTDKDVYRLKPIEGLMPDLMSLSDGCSFHDRCKYYMEVYRKGKPTNLETAPGHTVKYHLCDTREEEGSK